MSHKLGFFRTAGRGRVNYPDGGYRHPAGSVEHLLPPRDAPGPALSRRSLERGPLALVKSQQLGNHPIWALMTRGELPAICSAAGSCSGRGSLGSCTRSSRVDDIPRDDPLPTAPGRTSLGRLGGRRCQSNQIFVANHPWRDRPGMPYDRRQKLPARRVQFRHRAPGLAASRPRPQFLLPSAPLERFDQLPELSYLLVG